MDDETQASLATAENSAPPERMRLLRQVSQRAPEPSGNQASESRALLDELWATGRRSLAISLAEIGERADFLVDVLAESSSREMIRILSSQNVAGFPIDVVRAMLVDAPSAVRHRLYRSLRGQHAITADSLIEPVLRKWGDAEAAKLLPICSDETVAQHLPQLTHAVRNWIPLAKRHPERYLANLERDLTDLPPLLHESCWEQHVHALAEVAATRPQRTSEVLERSGPTDSLPAPVLRSRALASTDPARYLRLLLAPTRRKWLHRSELSRRVLAELAAAEPPELIEFSQAHHTWALLEALPPARRERYYDAGKLGDSGQFFVAGAFLHLLPAGRRHREARASHEALRRQGVVSSQMAAYLPLAEARAEADPMTKSSDALQRAEGYRLLFASAAQSRRPDAVADVLGEISRRIRNDQDPVRVNVLAKITLIQPWLFRSTPTETLDALVDDTMRARDRSGPSLDQISTLATRLWGGPHSAWSLRALARIFADTGSVDRLPAGAEPQLWEAIRETVDSQIARGRFEPLLQVARTYGKQGWDIPELQHRVRIAIERGAESVTRGAIKAWLDDPRRRAERVAEVLRLDRSAFTVPAVHDAVFRQRTDLFVDHIPTAPWDAGKFLPRGGRWTPLRSDGDRLSPGARGVYAARLDEIASDAQASIRDRTAAIDSLARVPGAADRIRRHTESDDVTVSEAALAALAWTDAPERECATLLAHASNDNAGVAATALARCARFVRPTDLVTLLEPTEGARVTSRKTLARLRILLPQESIMDFFPDEHADVRAALVDTAMHALADQRSWDFLRTSRTEHAPVLPLLKAHPFDIARRHRPGIAELITETARDSDAKDVAAHAIPLWNHWYPASGATLAATVVDLSDRRWRPFGQALLQLVRSGREHQEFGEAVRKLAEVAVQGGPTTVERDLPARQRLHVLINGLSGDGRLGNSTSSTTHELLRRTADTLLPHRTLLPLAARLRGPRTLRTDTAANFLADLNDMIELHQGRPAMAAHTTRELGRMPLPLNDSAELLHPVRELSRTGGLVDGLFAVVLCRKAGWASAWPDTWRDLLRELRNHPEPEVADTALAEFIAGE